MDFTLTPASNPEDSGSEGEFSVSTKKPGFSVLQEPVISSETATGADELPRSYGAETLCLMAPDPNTLFAYWDIDWAAAFRERVLLERKLNLRILRGDGSQEMSIEVEALGGECLLQVKEDNDAYTAELGYNDPIGTWITIATSTACAMPSGVPQRDSTSAEMATIPFHLGFQRMLDLLPTPRQASDSLVTMLSDLRVRAGSDATEFSASQTALVDTIDDIIAKTPPPPADLPAAKERWTKERLQRILSFPQATSSGGFPASSRLT